MEQLLTRLSTDYPQLKFKPGTTFLWSPSQQTVHFVRDASEATGIWSLLHEVGHGLLDHRDFTSDFGLLQMEVAAWNKARELAGTYGHDIDEDHIQDCLDTYRDWLHQRSNCPTCEATSLQQDSRTYRCTNCDEVWHVAQNRHCRPYRKRLEPSPRNLTPQA